jgi:chemotaxis signal transduction protein
VSDQPPTGAQAVPAREPHAIPDPAGIDGDDGHGGPGSQGGDAIVVRLGSGRFALPMAHVAEVGRVPAVTRVPGLPSWVSGAANWRGRILPVLDVRMLLGADPTDPQAGSRVLVLTDAGVTAGLLVDEVLTTTRFDPAEVAPYPPTLPASGLLAGQVVTVDGPVAVVDVDAVLRLRETLPRGRRTA